MRKLSLVINNQHPRRAVNARSAERIVEAILRSLRRGKDMTFEFVFVDDRAMRSYNRRFTGRGKNTDVLSFSLSGGAGQARERFGVIIISIDRALANARTFDEPVELELARYIAHGLLHLFGYDDVSERLRRRMWRRQDRLLELPVVRRQTASIFFSREKYAKNARKK